MKTVSALIKYTVQQTQQYPPLKILDFKVCHSTIPRAIIHIPLPPWSKVSTLKIVCVGFSSAHSETICHAGGMRQNSFTEQMFIEY